MQRRISGRPAALAAWALAAAAPLAFAPAAQAGTMDYNFAELSLLNTELDDEGIDVDGDGFQLRGSVEVHQNFFVYAGYQDLGFDEGIDATRFDIGAGGHWPLNERIDLVGRVGIVKAEVELNRFGADADEDGFLLGARLRGEIAPRFELEGGFDYVNLDDTGDDTTVMLEGRYFFLEQLSAGALIEFGDDATMLGAAVRWTF